MLIFLFEEEILQVLSTSVPETISPPCITETLPEISTVILLFCLYTTVGEKIIGIGVGASGVGAALPVFGVLVGDGETVPPGVAVGVGDAAVPQVDAAV